MLSERMEKALNEQLNAELYSAYLYLSMASYFDHVALKGLSRWMHVQALEELTHAMKFYNFLIDCGGRAIMQRLEAPAVDWESPLRVFEDVYRHEQIVTGSIHELVNLAMEEKDHAANNFLQWFVGEQVEEESSANGVLQRLKLIGNDRSGLFLLDQEMGQRVFNLSPGTSLVAGVSP